MRFPCVLIRVQATHMATIKQPAVGARTGPPHVSTPASNVPLVARTVLDQVRAMFGGPPDCTANGHCHPDTPGSMHANVLHMLAVVERWFEDTACDPIRAMSVVEAWNREAPTPQDHGAADTFWTMVGFHASIRLMLSHYEPMACEEPHNAVCNHGFDLRNNYFVHPGSTIDRMTDEEWRTVKLMNNWAALYAVWKNNVVYAFNKKPRSAVGEKRKRDEEVHEEGESSAAPTRFQQLVASTLGTSAASRLLPLKYQATALQAYKVRSLP
jgi:hypothetical protein